MTIDETIKEILSHAETDYDHGKLRASVKLLLKQQKISCRDAAAVIMDRAGVGQSGIAQEIYRAIVGAKRQ